MTSAKDMTVELACHARVSWFDVRQLSATAAKTIASTIIGSMSGRRELMAALEPGAQDHYDLAGEDSIWIDFVADCGDGWNASHSVAWLVGRDTLLLNRDGSPTAQPCSDDCREEVAIGETPEALLLPAGRALFLGGDEVYPTASREGYEERLVGAMRSARFQQTGGREVFAIPGNHDWYDGLTSFVRLFCQSPASRRWLGAWQTRQRRSYFAVALPHRWWLWGVDLALEDDFDPPQYDYFLTQARKLEPGDQVILSVPTPGWLEASDDDSDGVGKPDKLMLVIDAVVKEGATVPLIVTGDSHFYARHRADNGRPEDKRDYVICGGGGAFTLGTVQVPDTFDDPDVGRAREMVLFPSRSESRRLRWRVLGFPVVNRAFTATLVAIQLIALWVLRAHWTPETPARGLWPFVKEIGATLTVAPALVIWLLLIVGGFAAFGMTGTRDGRSTLPPTLIGGVHGAAQSAVALLFLWATLRLQEHTGILGKIALVGAALAATYLAVGLMFGLYLAVGHLLVGMHNLEVYSSQAIENWKGFLRIRIDRAGATVHPIGLRRSSRSWKPSPGVVQEAVSHGALVTRRKLRVPADCLRIMDPVRPLSPLLIEPPFVCGRPVANR